MFLTVDDQANQDVTLDRREPTYERIAEILGDIPNLVTLPNTQLTGEIVAWVGDDFQGRERLSEVHRNIVGSVGLWTLGAGRQPYAGPVVLTGISRDPLEGWLPVALAEVTAAMTRVLFDDIRSVTQFYDTPPGLPQEVAAQMIEYAAAIVQGAYEPMQVVTLGLDALTLPKE